MSHETFPTEADVEAVLYEHRGDAREAIRALLHDLSVLAEDYGADVSFGYVRGGGTALVLSRTGLRLVHRGNLDGAG